MVVPDDDKADGYWTGREINSYSGGSERVNSVRGTRSAFLYGHENKMAMGMDGNASLIKSESSTHDSASAVK